MQTAEADLVVAKVADRVMTITLNRPERGNAWSGTMALRYFEILEQAARSPEVRAMVLTGSGSDFREGIRSWQDGRAPTFQPLPENLALIDFSD